MILLGAATEERRRAAREEMRRLARSLDWNRLSDTLRRRRLLATLGPPIVAGAGLPAEAGFAGAVRQAVEAGRRHAAFLELVTQRLLAALAEAGIRAAPLKGPQLGETLYGDLGRRQSSDIDLLVAAEQLQAAVEVVRGFGYLTPTDPTAADGLPELHFALRHSRDELPPVELHWRIHWYERDFARERLLPPDLDPLATWRPAAADQLAALLQFYARDGFAGLRNAADVAAWWDAFGSTLPDGALDGVAGDYPALSRLLAAAATAAHRTVGAPPPPRGRRRDPAVRDRLAVRLANPNPRGSEAQVLAEMGLVDGLLSPPGGLPAFLRRQLLLPREVLDRQEESAGGARRRAAFGYRTRVLIRCGILLRYGLALARPAARP